MLNVTKIILCNKYKTKSKTFINQVWACQSEVEVCTKNMAKVVVYNRYHLHCNYLLYAHHNSDFHFANNIACY